MQLLARSALPAVVSSKRRGSEMPPSACLQLACACRWLAGAYFMLVTMLSVGYGDITPHTTPEIIVTMFALIAGIIFFGILLGSIAEALNVSAPPDSMCLSPSLHTAHLMRPPRQHCFWCCSWTE